MYLFFIAYLVSSTCTRVEADPLQVLLVSKVMFCERKEGKGTEKEVGKRRKRREERKEMERREGKVGKRGKVR